MEDAAPPGGYEQEEHAAEAYDVASLKAKGLKNPKLNYAVERCAVPCQRGCSSTAGGRIPRACRTPSSTTPSSGAPCMPERLLLRCRQQNEDSQDS
jgi:hypothetical protein